MDGEAQATELNGARGRRRTLGETMSGIRQRRLFRVAVGYAVGAWLIVQVVATIAPAFDLPPWTLRAVILLALAGFVATAAFVAFAGPDDVRSGNATERRRRLALAISAVLVLLAGAGALLYSQRAALFGQAISVAVLPFADLSPARDKAYFSEGVAEEILSALASEKDIKVLGRASARLIERNPDPKAIRASLGVTHLLEGSTRTSGDQLRVNVRLIDTADGSQMWEQEYQGRLADVFAVQDRIGATVVQRLRGTFFGGSVREAKQTSIDAYQTYLAARALMRDPKKESLTQAWKLARQIVDTHPDYAQGHAIYAELTHLLADGQYSYGNIPPDKARRIVLAHAKEAIRLAPDRAEGYAAVGLALPWQESVAPYRKALTLDPSRADVRIRLGIALNVLKRQDEAFEQNRLAMETDPLAPAVVNRYTQMLAASGQAEDAMRVIERFVHRGGSQAQGWRFRGNTYRYLADESHHVEARHRALQLDPGLPYQHEWLARALHLLGLDDQAVTYQGHISPYFQMFIADDRGALKAQVARDKAVAWETNGIETAIFSLARARDWPAIAQFYDLRPADYREICLTAPSFSPFLVMALQDQRQIDEARQLLNCVQQQVTRQLQMRHRGPDEAPGELEMMQASLLALQRDRRALDWLEKAVGRGWSGQYYSANLADWPQFDRLRSGPRLTAIQRRIDGWIAKERTEVLALR